MRSGAAAANSPPSPTHALSSLAAAMPPPPQQQQQQPIPSADGHPSAASDHQRINASIMSLIKRRGPTKSICPSEVARALFPSSWRLHMQAVRQQAWALAAEGRLVVTQVLNMPLVLICLRAIEIVPC